MQNPLSVRDATLEVLSDGHTAAPLIRVGYLHTLRGGKTFFLHFLHQTEERDFPQVNTRLYALLVRPKINYANHLDRIKNRVGNNEILGQEYICGRM